jgi:hypothetical protein
MTDASKPATLAAGLTNSVAAATVEVTASGDPWRAVMAAVAAFLPSAVQLAVSDAFETKLKRARRWWDEVVEGPGADAGVAADIQACARDPEIQQVLAEAFQRVMESRSPEVIPPLAMLTRPYAQGQEPDLFFRGFGRVLSDVTTNDFRALCSVFRLLNLDVASDVLELRLTRTQAPAEAAFRLMQMIRSERDGLEAPHVWLDGASADEAERLMRMLKTNYLNREFFPGFADQGLGPEALLIDKAIARRIRDILDRPSR